MTQSGFPIQNGDEKGESTSGLTDVDDISDASSS